MGLPLSEDPHSRKRIERYMKEYKKNHPDRRVTSNNYKQAQVPEGAIVLDNHNGTAPGLILEKNGKTAILLPGPPNELIPMFEESVFSYLRKKQPEIICSQVVKICGIGESQVAARYPGYDPRPRQIQLLPHMQRQERFISVLQPRVRMRNPARS